MKIITRFLILLLVPLLATGSNSTKQKVLFESSKVPLTEQCPPLLAQPNQQGEFHNFHCDTSSKADNDFNHYPFLPELLYGGNYGGDSSLLPFRMLIQPEKIWLWQQALEREREREKRVKAQHREKSSKQSIVKETRDATLYSLP